MAKSKGQNYTLPRVRFRGLDLLPPKLRTWSTALRSQTRIHR